MTVIVYDGKTLASDSQMSLGSINTGSIPKIFELADGSYFGGCGSYQDVIKVREWLEGGEHPGDVDCSGIIVRPDRSVEMLESGLVSYVVEPPVAIGSGYEVAYGALGAGAKAERAVEVACKYDVSCSLPVQTVKLRTPRKK